MALVSYARYVTVTGDSTSASASAVDALARAQDLLEDELCRIGLLEDDSVDKVERLRLYEDSVLGGTVYPGGLPITSDGDYTQAGETLTAVGPDAGPVMWRIPEQRWATVTYRGGYTSSTVPAYMERDIAVAAYQLLHSNVLVGVPAGATDVALGDARIGFASPAAGGSFGIGWSRETLRHRRRKL